MRQIKFRGKRKDNGEWVVGSLVKIIVNIKFYILPLNTVIDDDSKIFDSLIEIRPDTVSQFTGSADKNMRDIYEKDIISNGTSNYVIEYRNGAFRLIRHNMSCYTISDVDMSEFEIIGNIHDNPELLNPQ